MNIFPNTLLKEEYFKVRYFQFKFWVENVLWKGRFANSFACISCILRNQQVHISFIRNGLKNLVLDHPKFKKILRLK